jgi:glutamine cyclotransferase
MAVMKSLRKIALIRLLAAGWLLLPLSGCHSEPNPPTSNPPQTAQATAKQLAPSNAPAKQVGFEVVKAFPHDRNAFTEGLLWHDGALYESVGREYFSSVRRVDLETGKVLQMRRQPDDVFSEGLVLFGDRLIQLSWKNQRAFVYDIKSFDPVREWTYTGEGWGITTDGTSLIMSNGSEYLTWRDPKTFAETRRVAVTLDGKPLNNINELEWINGEVWANVWQTDYIVRIDPQSGAVKSYLDCSNLLPRRARTGNEDVLNGIAYDPEAKRILVTGKLWPRLFEIKLSEPGA